MTDEQCVVEREALARLALLNAATDCLNRVSLDESLVDEELAWTPVKTYFCWRYADTEGHAYHRWMSGGGGLDLGLVSGLGSGSGPGLGGSFGTLVSGLLGRGFATVRWTVAVWCKSITCAASTYLSPTFFLRKLGMVS